MDSAKVFDKMNRVFSTYYLYKYTKVPHALDMFFCFYIKRGLVLLNYIFVLKRIILRLNFDNSVETFSVKKTFKFF